MCGLTSSDDSTSSDVTSASKKTLLEKGSDSAYSVGLPTCEDHRDALKDYDT